MHRVYFSLILYVSISFLQSDVLMKCMNLLLVDLGSVFRPSVDQFVAAAERLLCVEVLARSTALPLLNMFLRIFLDNLQQQPNQRKVCIRI